MFRILISIFLISFIMFCCFVCGFYVGCRMMLNEIELREKELEENLDQRELDEAILSEEFIDV